MPIIVSSSGPSDKSNIFLGLIEYELYSLLDASHLVSYISVHILFDLERYLLNISTKKKSSQMIICRIKTKLLITDNRRLFLCQFVELLKSGLSSDSFEKLFRACISPATFYQSCLQ